MTLITKPDFTYVWASGGAIVAPNDAKKQTGWVAEAPPFQYDNWLQNRQDQMLAHINQRGIAAWDGLTNYEAGGLSYVQGSDGKIYKSVLASGPASVVSNPTTDLTDTYWTEAFASVGAFLTQAAGDGRYAQRANNLSDLTNAATARANLGVSDAVDGGVQGAYSGLKLTTTGLSALVSVTANSLCLKDVNNSQKVVNSLSVTPSMSASGVNGLDTGTSAANTWYSVWVIWNGTTTAGLFSLSATAPTLPSGYTHKARVGWVRTDSTGNKYPLRIVQWGNQVRYAPLAGTNTTAVPVIAQGVQASGTAYAVGSFVPPTASVIHGICAPDATYRSAAGPSLGFYDLFYVTSGAGTPLTASVFFALLLEGSNIYGFQSGAASRTLVYGWEDNL